MTSSVLSPVDEYGELLDLDSVVLDAKTTKGLSQPDIVFVKQNVLGVNEGLAVAGNAFTSAMKSLVAIKQNVKKTNWVALTESDAITMSGRMARDYAAAWETWLKDADIPDDVIAKTSARTLAKIGKADAGKRTHAINKMKKGGKVVDQDLSRIVSNAKTDIRRQIDDLVDQAEIKAKRTPDKEKVEKYGQLIVENLRLKAKVEELEFKLDRANKALVTATSKRASKAPQYNKAGKLVEA